MVHVDGKNGQAHDVEGNNSANEQSNISKDKENNEDARNFDKGHQEKEGGKDYIIAGSVYVQEGLEIGRNKS